MSEQWMLDSINISFLSQSETGLHLHFQASYSKLLEGYVCEEVAIQLIWRIASVIKNCSIIFAQ